MNGQRQHQTQMQAVGKLAGEMEGGGEGEGEKPGGRRLVNLSRCQLCATLSTPSLLANRFSQPRTDHHNLMAAAFQMARV